MPYGNATDSRDWQGVFPLQAGCVLRPESQLPA